MMVVMIVTWSGVGIPVPHKTSIVTVVIRQTQWNITLYMVTGVVFHQEQTAVTQGVI